MRRPTRCARSCAAEQQVREQLYPVRFPAVFRQAVDCLTVPGVCALVGAAPLGTEVTLDMNSIMFGCTVMGIVEGQAVPRNFIPQLIDLYRRGQLPLEKIVKVYAFDELNEAVRDSESGRVVKEVPRL